MFRATFSNLISTSKLMQSACNIVPAEQIRMTHVLKRLWPPNLDRKEAKRQKPLKTKNFLYESIGNEDMKRKDDIELILTSYVEGVGMKNDVVKVRPNFGRTKLLLTGLAIYATPENLEKLTSSPNTDTKEVVKHSSRFSSLTQRELSKQVLNLSLNKYVSWTVEKWHIRSAFRRSGYQVPDHAIVMPETPITGPNMELDGRQFLVTVTINNTETVIVRCQIHHVSTLPEDKRPFSGWRDPAVPVFEHERDIISQLPAPA